MSNIINPISTNQVAEVSLMKPDHANFCGNTLNDWLKWLVDKQGEINWKAVDTACLTLGCDKNLKSIIEALIAKVCTLEQDSGCGCGSGCGPSPLLNYPLVLLERWANVESNNPATGYIQDGWVKLSGTINAGSTLVPIFNVPADLIPTNTKRLTFSHSYSLPNVANEQPFLQISTSGVATMVWTGITPVTSLIGSIFLDGIQYKK
jgi:hypothetical protein